MTVQALTCPHCGAAVALRAAGRILSVVCGSCGSTLDAAAPELRLLLASAEAHRRPEIALGSRAALGGIEWEVIGYLERSADEESWCEYLLFNPWEGFRFLVDDGRFWLAELLDRHPDVEGRQARHAGRSWHGTARYVARVDFVLGEFYWRVAVGETVHVAQYAGDGAELSSETGPMETSWSRLDPCPPGSVEEAFGIPVRTASLPPLHSLWRTHMVIATVAAMAMMVISLFAPPAARVGTTRIDVPINGDSVTTTIGPLHLPRAATGVEIRAAASLDNEWIELDYELVDRRTQASYPVDGLAEFYTGYDSEGRWSEGDPQPARTMARIPRGDYDLVIEAKGASWPAPGFFDPPAPVTRTVPVAVDIRRDIFFTENFVLALIALFAWPVILLLLDTQQEDEDAW